MSERSFTVRLLANISQYKAKMDEAAQATSGFSDGTEQKLDKAGRKMQEVGGKMTRRLTLPLIGAAGAAVKMSSDFNTAFAQMVGLAGVPADEVDQLKDAVLGLAGETARAPTELAEALYFAASAGLDSAQAMDAVEIAAKAASAGLGSTQDIVGLAASAIAVYGAENITAAEATDILVSTIREGRAEPAELAGTLGRILPIANQLGVSFGEVGGVVATLTNAFGDTNRAVTAAQDMFVKFVPTTEQGKQALLDMGTSAGALQAAIDKDGLLGGLELLRSKGFAENSDALRLLFSDVQGYAAASQLLGMDQKVLAETFGETTNAMGSLDTALAAIDQDTQGMKQAWVDLQVAMIQAGEILLPIVADLVSGVAGLANTFTDMPGPVQKLVLGFLAIVAIAGPMLSFFGTIIRNLAMIKLMMVGLGKVILAHPLLALATVLAAVGVAMLTMGDDAALARKQVKALADEMDAAGGAGEGLRSYLSKLVDGFDPLLNAMDATGVTVDDLASAVEAGGTEMDEMRTKLLDAAAAAGVDEFQMMALKNALSGMTDTNNQAIARQEARARVHEETAEVVEDETGAINIHAESLRLSAMAAQYLADEEEDLKAAQEASAEAALKAAAAQQEYIDTVMAAVTSVFDYEKATIKLDRVVEDYAKQEAATALILLDTEKSVEEKKKAVEDLTDAEFAAVEQMQATALEYAEAGARDNSAASAQMQIDKLGDLKREYPALGALIDQYVDQLLLVPGTIDTTAHLSTGAAFRAMSDLEQALYRMSQRSWYIPVYTTGSTAANWQGRSSADGGYFGKRDITEIAEAGAEAVFPLTRPARMRALMEDPRISGPVMAAMGSPGMHQNVVTQAAASNKLTQILSLEGANVYGVPRDDFAQNLMNQFDRVQAGVS